MDPFLKGGDRQEFFSSRLNWQFHYVDSVLVVEIKLRISNDGPLSKLPEQIEAKRDAAEAN